MMIYQKGIATESRNHIRQREPFMAIHDTRKTKTAASYLVITVLHSDCCFSVVFGSHSTDGVESCLVLGIESIFIYSLQCCMTFSFRRLPYLTATLPEVC